MHDSRKVFLLDTEPRCVLCSYESHEGAPRTEFKTWDTDIKVGDYVVVPTDTRHHMTVVRVEEIDVEPNLESNERMHWIVDVVDKSAFDRTANQEREFLNAARAAEKQKKKEALKEAFLANVPDSALALAHKE